jgi:hypothetical protein
MKNFIISNKCDAERQNNIYKQNKRIYRVFVVNFFEHLENLYRNTLQVASNSNRKKIKPKIDQKKVIAI